MNVTELKKHQSEAAKKYFQEKIKKCDEELEKLRNPQPKSS